MPGRVAGLVFAGACDASAAVCLPDGRVVVADDERPNVLRVYRLDGTRHPQREPAADRHLAAFLGDGAEADLEATAHAGGLIAWLGSHGRDAAGAWRPARQVILATDPHLVPVGRPYRDLLAALVLADQGWRLGLAKAIGALGTTVPALAPERSGLSIEGAAHLPAVLAGTPGEVVLLGLRNPAAADGRAILLPLLNLPAVLTLGAEPAFAAPYLLDLDGLRVRDLAWWDERDMMLILAGTKDDRADFRLYGWSGQPGDSPRLLQRLHRLNPEAVLPLDGARLLLLSDDGDRLVRTTARGCRHAREDGRCRCKDLADPARRRSRGHILRLG